MPRTSAIRTIVASVTQGRPCSIARHSSTRAGAAPVTPTSASSGAEICSSAKRPASSSWSNTLASPGVK